MEIAFSGEVIEWRGPAPFLFVPVPAAECAELRSVASMATYGWGVIPVTLTVGRTTTTTSLFPRQGGYLVPIKVAVQRAESLELGSHVTLRLSVHLSPR